jgi:hypothetical protein
VTDKLDQKLVDAWQTAAEDLGFRFVSPFAAVDKRGATVFVEGFLPDFGGPEGMTVVSATRRFKPGESGRPYCILPIAERKYRRESVIETLKDFGWYGSDGDRPVWLRS